MVQHCDSALMMMKVLIKYVRFIKYFFPCVPCDCSSTGASLYFLETLHNESHNNKSDADVFCDYLLIFPH